MLPVVTPSEMTAIDAAASEPIGELIQRAGWAVAREALGLLGGGYGRRVAVFAGRGNNGADGVAAARFLERRGVRCEILAPDGAPRHRADLVIDGCVGTGLSRGFSPPEVGSVPVLAIDIPSGVNGLTGEVANGAIRANRTVTFAAYKPGLLLGSGATLSGEVVVADIGLDVGTPSMHLMTDSVHWPRRATDAHKWQSAVWVIGGQPGMTGAPSLAAEAAARSGAGYVAVSTPSETEILHREAVQIPLPAGQSEAKLLELGPRFGSFVIGPGLSPVNTDSLAVALELDIPTVLDAGAIDWVASAPHIVTDRPVVLTPHDGEFERLTGRRPGTNRVADVRAAANSLRAVVLLKGPTTVIAAPDGEVRLVAAGDQRLATAGTGDVLAGVIGAALALGLDPLDAAAIGAQAHGRAGERTGQDVILASDLLAFLV